MLMISRRAGERIVIDGDIEVVVTEIRRRSVRLGVSGGEGKLIVRGEVHDAIVAANTSAAESSLEESDFEDLFSDPQYSAPQSEEPSAALVAEQPAATSSAPEAR